MKTAPEPLPDFGVDWSRFARPPSLLERHNGCALMNIGKGSFYHRRELIRTLWPKYEWHRWSERRLKSTCECSWVTWMAPGGAGKSCDAAVQAIQWWLEAPHETAVIVCSTTMKLLRMRIWSDVAKYHGQLPANIGPVGELMDSETRVRWRKGDDKNGIFGMAVEEGPIEEVLNNLIGIHTHRLWLILDEMQGVREAIMKATLNMSKNPVFRFLGMGNPTGLLNPLGRESEPVNGWDSVVRGETETWETHGGPVKGGGRCDFFDGRKSPAEDSPEELKRLYFLIKKEWIDNHLRSVRGNENDPLYWAQAIGWPPPMGLESTVLDDSILVKFKCMDPAVWTEGFFKWSSFDPSFEGKDRKVLTFGRCGETGEDGPRRWQIGVDEQIEVPVDSESDEPIHYQIVKFVMPACQQRGVRPAFFGLDSSGEGGGLAAIFKKEWGPVIEVEFGGKPSDLSVDSLGKLAKDAYNSRSSELNFLVREFALGNGLRGLPEDAAKQACARRTFFKNGKWCVEPKTAARGLEKGFKQRLGYSPDALDSIAVGVDVCRQHGAIPSIEGKGLEVANEEWNVLAKETSNEYSEDNYLTADTWADY